MKVLYLHGYGQSVARVSEKMKDFFDLFPQLSFTILEAPHNIDEVEKTHAWFRYYEDMEQIKQVNKINWDNVLNKKILANQDDISISLKLINEEYIQNNYIQTLLVCLYMK